MLGPGNEDAAREACEAWRGGLQVGGGINDENARRWVEELGAEKVWDGCFFISIFVALDRSQSP